MVQQKVAVEEQKRLQILHRIQEYDVVIEQSFQDQQHTLDQGTLDLTQMQNFPNYIWRLKQNRFQEFQTLQNQEHKLQTMREELKQALIKKKSLDILKDKEYGKYCKQVEKVEEEFLAEIALTRAIRKPVSKA